MRRRGKLPGVAWCLSILGLVLTTCAPAMAPAPTADPSPSQARSDAKITPPSRTPSTIAQQPRYGGILNVTLSADMPSFDVHQETARLTQAAVQSCYSSLLQNEPSDPDKIIGDLAEKWDISPDGTLYTFHLPKGVKFHDGSTLTADDVIFSLERIYKPPKNILSPRKETLAIKSVAVLDQDTVRIALEFGQSSFLPMMANGQLAIYPRKVVEAKGDMKRDIVGSGPFIYVRYSPGTVFEVKRNPNYFVKGRPYLDGLRFYVLRDESTKLAAFRAGRVSLIDPSFPGGLRPWQLQIIRKEMPEVTTINYPALSGQWLNMVVTMPPFDDARARRAVSLGVDRQAVIKVIADGEADVGGIFVSGGKWAAPEAELLNLPGYRQPKDADITEAKRLLAEAGFAKGLKARVLARSMRSDKVAVLLKEQLAKIGIELEVVVQESTVFLEQMYKQRHPLVAQPVGLRVSDPDDFARYFVSSGAANGLGLKNDEVDALFDKQARTLDPGERHKLIRQLDVKLLELSPSVVLYWERGCVAHWPAVKNFYRGMICYNNSKYQDVWLAN